MLYIVAIGWMFVVVMVSVAEALAPQGSLLGAALTFLGWGVLPLSVVLYILGTPVRRRARTLTRSPLRSSSCNGSPQSSVHSVFPASSCSGSL